ncbi:hypothetical protein SCHPADRAFT_360083 [Schizopora paradoxa]|uniref:C2H2-type domain-containing protein n=1 Tax=Schizopora paradoxa TaxID=27342 RepID=A0A0H2RVU3_9AGAM|nr:hypothetical protein SCHPADRAFT_360083 [Schizopora paradoxa]
MQTPANSPRRHHFPFPYYLLAQNMEAFRQGIQSDDIFWGVGSPEDLLTSSHDFNREMDAFNIYHNSPAMSSNSSISSYSPHTPSPALLPDLPLPLVMNNDDFIQIFQNSPNINSIPVLYSESSHSAVGLQGVTVTEKKSPQQFCSSELAHALEERPKSTAGSHNESPRPQAVVNTFPSAPPSTAPSPCISTSLLARSDYFENTQQYCASSHAGSTQLPSSTTSDWGHVGIRALPFVPDSSTETFNFAAAASADVFETTSTALNPRVFDLGQSQVYTLAESTRAPANIPISNAAPTTSEAPMVVVSSNASYNNIYASALDLNLGTQSFKSESPAPQPLASSFAQYEEDSDSDPEWMPFSRAKPSRRTASRTASSAPRVASQSHCPKHPSKRSPPTSTPTKPCPDKTFWCFACNRGFSRAADKERHMDTYHKLQGIPCHICKGTFSRADALRRHLLKGCSGKARKRRSRAWELAAQRAAQGSANTASASVKMESIPESMQL